MTDNIYGNFKNPPASCTQIPFWFLNGEVDGDEYSRQIQEMARQGVKQAMPHPRYGMDRRDYLTDKFWLAMEKLIRKAAETGFTIHLYDEFNWSSGTAGAKVTAEEENRALGVNMRAKTVTGPARVTFDNCEDQSLLVNMLTNWSEREDYLRILMAPVTEQDTVDFERSMELDVPPGDQDIVGVEVPAGRFEVMVFFTLRMNHPSPIAPGCGGVVDYLSAESTRKFIDYTHNEYAKRFGAYFGNTIMSIFYDESGPFSAGSFTWTNRFTEEFIRLKGYDIVKNLHHLFYDADEMSEKVRCDYWDVVAEMFSENFIGQIADWCAAHGISLTGHSFEEIHRWNWAADPYRLLRRQQWPGTDSLGSYKNYSEIKLAQGVADISGKRVLACEAVGCMDGWSATLRKAKRAYNQLAVAGVTHTIPHAFFQTLDNAKIECPPSFFIHNPYWKYYHHLADMTARQNWINRQGVHVADIAVFYPLVSWWGDARGGRAFGLPQGHSEGVYSPASQYAPDDPKAFNDIIDTLMRHQLDMDVIDSKGLEEASMRDGRIDIAGESFRILILPPMKTIRLSDLKRFNDFADADGILVTVGRWPSISMEKGRNDRRVSALVEELRTKAQTVDNAFALPGVLRRLITPDITVADGNSDIIDASHRRIVDEDGRRIDFYLIANIDPRETMVGLKLRAVGDVALWNNENGNAYRLEGKHDGECTEISLRLGPYEAPYVVIGKRVDDGLPELPVERREKPVKIIPVEGRWLFKTLPGEDPDVKTDADTPVELEMHVFKTTQIYDEDPRFFDPTVWSEFFKPDFDDSKWEMAHCAHRPLLYDDWYGSRVFRTVIPAGADAIKLPVPINCEYVIYVNGTRVRVATEHTEEEAGWLDIPICDGAPGVLAVECRSISEQYGITGPFVFRCRPQSINLRSWVDHGLWWYSGYGLYQKEIDLSDVTGQTVFLNLGEVRESAEIWVNGRQAGERIWPPYEADITQLLKPGKNVVRVVASNLLANRFYWAWRGRRDGTYNIPESGLLGPVTLELYKNRH